MSATLLATTPADITSSAPRRKSGRVSKKPERLVPASSPPVNAKRKRSDEADAGADADELSEKESSAASSEGEPDEEELREQRRKKKAKPQTKKPAPKKPKTNGETLNLAIRPAAAKPKKARKAPVRKSAIAEDADGLYGDVFAHGNKLEDVAAQWVQNFHNHEARAVADIVNFVLRAAGCNIMVDEDDIADPDNCPSRMGDIQDEFQAQSISEYPLIAKTRGANAFKHALYGFFVALVQTLAQSGLMYENTELLENIEVWISTMSSASNRPFRHTSTVASLGITSALSSVARDIVENTAKKMRQSESEAKKARANKARVAAINKEVEELNQKLELVDASITDWFDTVYVHRYRDVDPKVRVECVEALAEWILIYPDKFFDGSHLRYLGWVLSDPHPPTRVEVLKQLQKLFRDKDKLAGLKTFTERFRPRIVEMATHDAETNVRAAAVELLDILREAGFLEPDDVDSVGRLVFDAEPKVRKAVVGFFAETINGVYEAEIEDMGGQEALDEALAGDDDEDEYSNPRLEWLKLKNLVAQLIAYDSEDAELPTQIERLAPSGSELGLMAAGIESRFFLAAQALYDAIPEIRDWEVLAGYLLHDHSQTEQNGAGDDAETMLKNNCKLNEREETVLLDTLNAAVKLRLQRLEEASKDKKKTKAEKKALDTERDEIVKKLSILIPQLLKKFGALPEAASLCLRLERELNLDIFQELRQNAALTALIDDVNKQFLTHHNENVLDEAVESILHALTHDDTKELAESKVQGLWDDLINTFNVLRGGRDFSKSGNLPGNIINGVSNIVLKISKLSKVSEPAVLDIIPSTATASRAKGKGKKDKNSQPESTSPPITSLLQILDRGVPTASSSQDADSEILENALVRHAMNALLLYFVWKFRHVASSIETSTPISDDDLTSIADNRDQCLQALMRIMEARKGADELRLEAAYLLLDIYNLFFSLKTVGEKAKRRRTADDEENLDWEALCQPIDAPTSKALIGILGAAESAYAKRTKKHLEEPDVDEDPIDPDDEPESSDDEEQDDADEARNEERKLRTLLAEGRLCFLGSRMVNGVQVGTLDGEIKKRLEKNKTRLGNDWKEVVGHLDVAKTVKGRGKKGGAKVALQKARGLKEVEKEKRMKSKEIVIEDDDEEEEGVEVESDEIEDEEMGDGDEHAGAEQVNGDGASGDGDGDGREASPESLLGD
ncbi:STAG-domain-containing protein [Lophiostoma macrostomum CBS 122681]|uniref:STAG-domain-containing protein n=1 Tax=Lophiostoma macrostomum CBS 122681 TaxID=1314788 RepID=A0A6A6SWT9_9PLEO|nr:STAG-domain-containing protein [Lophiostoma macrostomum CBS 122681]